MSSRAGPSRWALALSAVVVVGAGLRLAAATPGLLGDELFTYSVTGHGSLGGVFDGIRTYEANPPALYVLTWAVRRVWDAPQAVRTIPFITGTALIAMVAVTARRVAGPVAGIAAGALAAVSPFFIYYGSEGRAYTPAALAVVCAAYCVLRALDAPDERRWWVGFGAAALAGAYLHYTALFPLAALGLWTVVLHPRARRPAIVAAAAAALLYLPWVPSMRAAGPLAFVAILGHKMIDNVVFSVRTIVGDPYQGSFADVPGTARSLVLAAVVAATLVMAIRRSLPVTGPLAARLRHPLTLMLAIAVAAPAGIQLYDVFSVDLLSTRNVFVSAPAVVILAAALLSSVPGRWAAVAPVLAVLALAYPAARMAFGDLRRPPTDEAAALLDRVARPQDPVLQSIGLFDTQPPLRRRVAIYLRRPHRLYDSDLAGDHPWEQGMRTGRVFVYGAVPRSGLRRYNNPVASVCPDPRFELRRHLLAKRGFTVVEYTRRRGIGFLRGEIEAVRGARRCSRRLPTLPGLG